MPFFFCTHFPLPFPTSQVANLCPLPYGCACALRPASAIPVLGSSPASNRFPMALRCNTPASNSSAIAPRPTAPPPRRPRPATNLIGAPAGNKPHLAERSTPVWLAIWCIWAGFANSQLLPDAAALSSMQGPQRSGNSSAQTSASLHPPAALRLRVLPFTRRGH